MTIPLFSRAQLVREASLDRGRPASLLVGNARFTVVPPGRIIVLMKTPTDSIE